MRKYPNATHSKSPHEPHLLPRAFTARSLVIILSTSTTVAFRLNNVQGPAKVSGESKQHCPRPNDLEMETLDASGTMPRDKTRMREPQPANAYCSPVIYDRPGKSRDKSKTTGHPTWAQIPNTLRREESAAVKVSPKLGARKPSTDGPGNVASRVDLRASHYPRDATQKEFEDFLRQRMQRRATLQELARQGRSSSQKSM